jgi:hypothetical protein
MPSYCSVTELKTYLNISANTDDALLQVLLDAATSRIDALCGRVFQASADSVRYFDPTRDVGEGGWLWLDADLSHVTSIINGDAAQTNITAQVFTEPRNVTPFYALGLKTSASATWEYNTDAQNAIAITGRWAFMERASITAITRATNSVTASVYAPRVSVGQTVFVLDCADASFDGAFTVTANTGSAITWSQTGSNDTDTTAILLYTPNDIVHACKRLAAWLYRQKDTQQTGAAQPLFTSDGSIVMPSTLPTDVSELLVPYIRLL